MLRLRTRGAVGSLRDKFLARRAAGPLAAVSTMALTLLLAVVFLRLWRLDLGAPMAYSSDGAGSLMIMKGILEHGWYFRNPSMGVPFGQEFYDFPVLNADNLNVLIVKLFGLFTHNPAVVVNLYFLATFPLIALSAFLVLRHFRISAPVAAVVSILFVFLPYHLRRGEFHLFPAGYYAVPIGAYLALAVLRGESLFARRQQSARPRLLAWASWPSIRTILLCLVVAAASGSLYYAPFTLVLVAFATIFRFVLRPRRAAVTGAVVAAVIAGTLLLELSPSVVYRSHHPPSDVAKRQPRETEIYSLKLAELVLPVERHRLAPLARLTDRYRSTTPLNAEGGSSLGLVGDVGFFWLFGVLAVSALGARRSRGADVTASAAVLTLVAFVVATTGGLATVLAYVVTPQLRTWDRMSVFVAFFALLAVAMLLESLRTAASSPLERALFPALLVTVLVVGLLDQTNNSLIPRYGSIQRQYRTDAAFVAAVERLLPPGATVYELPYVAFPESRSHGSLPDYELAKPYVHSHHLRWSYGAIKNGPADWAAALATRPIPIQVAAVASAGFGAIYVDRFGFADRGRAVVTALRTTLHKPALQSATGRYLLFDLRPYAHRFLAGLSAPEATAARLATLEPVRAFLGDDFYGPEANGHDVWRWSRRPNIALRMLDPSSSPRRVSVQGMLGSGNPGGAFTRIVYPDGSSAVLGAGNGTRFRATFTLLPGWHTLRVTSDATRVATPASDPRSLFLKVTNLRFSDRTFGLLEGQSLLEPLTSDLTIS